MYGVQLDHNDHKYMGENMFHLHHNMQMYKNNEIYIIYIE